MLFALSRPVALAGLALAFVLALVIRVLAIRVVQRRQVPAGWGTPRRSGGKLVDVRRDVDIFGVVAAVVGGTGWGKKVEDSGMHPAPVRVLLAGPIAVIVAAQLAFLAFVLVAGRVPLGQLDSSSVLRGDLIGGTSAELFLLSLAVGLLCFGLLDLVPLPPLDGWGLLRHAVKRPGTGFQKARHWLEDQNVGIAILLAGMLLPLFRGLPLFLFLLDIFTLPFLLLWG
ncbi:hypothetical protein [Cryptosporangium aurantiacum]|uniref:Peptidase family M50 n=1 Tax=Cryptosporangium aurantiacum TaxID=134849 RepID=A0A1M7RP82_9ACTN|nr:hypothetical protein [Cryptosporangium aurantiacum]SHN47868.1 hypothetical protein SAMN05443668_12928 [Cryptosporangium aurantiacum]